MTSMGTGWLWGGIAALLGLLAPVLWSGRKRWGRGPGVGLSVIVVGGSQIVLQLSLLLGFQILEGFVYTELALIVSSFIVGIALGSALFDHCAPRSSDPVSGWHSCSFFLWRTWRAQCCFFSSSIRMTQRLKVYPWSMSSPRWPSSPERWAGFTLPLPCERYLERAAPFRALGWEVDSTRWISRSFGRSLDRL